MKSCQPLRNADDMKLCARCSVWSAKIQMLQVRNVECVLEVWRGVLKKAIGEHELPPERLEISGINRSLSDAGERTRLTP